MTERGALSVKTATGVFTKFNIMNYRFMKASWLQKNTNKTGWVANEFPFFARRHLDTRTIPSKLSTNHRNSFAKW